MPLKDMSKEKPSGEKKEKPSGEKREQKKTPPTDTAPEAPFKVEPDGTKVRVGRRLPYEREIEQLLTEISGGVALADAFTANAISTLAPDLAYGYARLAKDDKRVAAFFKKLLTGSSWSAAILPTGMLVVMVGFHFGIVPPNIGVLVATMNGVEPYTRQEETEKKQEFMAQMSGMMGGNGAAGATHPHGEPPQA